MPFSRTNSRSEGPSLDWLSIILGWFK